MSKLQCNKCGCKKWKHKFVGIIQLKTCTRCGWVMSEVQEVDHE